MRADFQSGVFGWWTVAIILVCLGPSSTFGVVMAACGGKPTVVTDAPDYDPHGTAIISRTNIGCGEVLSVQVTAPDGRVLPGNGTGLAGPDLVSTDGG